MLELPEVEVLRRDLEKEFVGKKIKAVDAKSMAALPRYKNRKTFTSVLIDAKITNVSRKGVYLLVGLDNARTLVIDVGTGYLRKLGGREKDVPPAEITFSFAQGGSLVYVMTGPGGNFFTVTTETIKEEWPEFAGLGFDPVEVPIAWSLFGNLMARHPSSVKHFLVDQTIMSGIGDAYADEILFNAGVRHDRRTETLSSQEIRRLYRGLVETLHEAIKCRGMALPDEGYVDLYGKPGDYQPQVFRREGKRSPRSRNPIQKVKFEGRWTYFCDTQV